MQLSPNFSLEEFEASPVAERLGIYNKIGDSKIMEAAQRTCGMLEKIRKYLSVYRGRDIPIKIVDGYRCAELNRAMWGALISSDNMKGAAVGWTAPSFGEPRMIAQLLEPLVDDFGIGQLTLEFPDRYDAHILCSTIRPMRKETRVLTHTDSGYKQGIR